MTREAFKALLRHPQTTILLDRWAKEEEVERLQRERNEDVYLSAIQNWFRRTDQVTK